MTKLNIFKFALSIAVFFYIIKVSDVKIDTRYVSFETFLILFFFLGASLFFISLRTNIIYNKFKKYKFSNIFFFNIFSWSASTLLVSGTNEILKFFFFKDLKKVDFFCYLIFEKMTFVISFLFIVTLFMLVENFFFNSGELFIFFIFFIIFLLSIYLFYKSFYIKIIPYINFLNFNIKQISNLFSTTDNIKLIIVNIIIQLIPLITFYKFFLINVKV
jgi:hypothetical protein